MATPIRSALAAVVLLGAAAVAGAQEGGRRPRIAIGREPEPVRHTVPYSPYPGASVTVYPQANPGQHARRGAPRVAPATVIYVPVPVYAGYEAQSPVYGGVTDVNGRPLSIGFDAGPSAFAPPSYTPDLSGSPYVVIENAMMLTDLPNGERRAFPSCAAESAARGPDGQARTIFYQPSEYGLVLREGQRGRVQGVPAPGTRACYGIDAFGRIALLP